MFETLRTLATSPNDFFRQRRETPSLSGPAIILAAFGCVVVLQVLVATAALGRFESAVGGGTLTYTTAGLTVSAPRNLVFATVLTFFLMFLVWIAGTVLTYGVSRLMDADGSVRGLLGVTGWAILPLLVPPSLKSIAFTVLVGLHDPFASGSAARTWLTGLADHPAMLGIELAEPVFGVSAAYLWLLATQHGLDLSRRRALLAASLPLLYFVLNSLGAYVVIATSGLPGAVSLPIPPTVAVAIAPPLS